MVDVAQATGTYGVRQVAAGLIYVHNGRRSDRQTDRQRATHATQFTYDHYRSLLRGSFLVP